MAEIARITGLAPPGPAADLQPIAPAAPLTRRPPQEGAAPEESEPAARTAGPEAPADLAAADLELGSVWLLLNRGDRSFDVRELRVGVGRWLSAVTAVDVDRDGALDLVVTDMAQDELIVLLGDGAGGFSVAQTIPTGRGPAALASADFDGDGRLDLAVAHFHEDSVGIWLGDGVGGFRPGGLYAAGLGPVDVRAGDLNGDGFPDLVVANARSPWLTVLLNEGVRRGRGRPALAPGERVRLGPPSESGAQGAALGDFDGDGALDLAVAGGGGAGGEVVTVRLGDGRGRFPDDRGRELPVAGQPVALLAEDLDGSGFPDLVVVRFDSDSVSLLLNEL